MKPLEWLALAALGVVGYFFWRSRQTQTTSPACPAQTQLDGWLSDIATGKMTTDDANKLAQSYAGATPPCTDAVSAINAAIAAKGGIVKASSLAPIHSAAPLGKAPPPPGGVLYTPPGTLVPHSLTDAEAAEFFGDFADTAGFPGLLTDFLAANPKLAVYAPPGGWPPNTSFRYTYSDSGTTAYPAGHATTFVPTGRFGPGDVPTYTSTNPAITGEWTFAAWDQYTNDAPGGGYQPARDASGKPIAPDPTPATSSSGQRLNNLGVWIWEPGTQVMIKNNSPAAASTAGVGFAPPPLLLAAEPWQ